MADQNEALEPEKTAETPKKKLPGRPFTSETAKALKAKADAAKAMRKKVRAEMLQTLCTKADLGLELYKAMKAGDEKAMNAIEKAIKIVGLHFDQSEDSITKLDVKSDNKVDAKVQVSVTGLND
jgi:hypothetical protein